MLTLHDNITSGNGYKCRLMLALKGTPYKRIEYDIDKAETRTPAFLGSVNPNGRIPVLELEDGTCLPESNAILYYLAQGTDLWPSNQVDRARVLSWMCFEQYSHEPNIATVRYWITHKVEMMPARKAAMPGKREQGYAALDVMEKHLSAKDWFAAGRYTIADIALYAYTHVAEEGGFDLKPYPAVRAWISRVASKPGHIPITQG
ncbi:MAG: glutathione S-transferase family protein [Alphaproteobacteria bacterium]|nr:glutathione S-transferase family protein [Alphaproteobacteria bacterium]